MPAAAGSVSKPCLSERELRGGCLQLFVADDNMIEHPPVYRVSTTLLARSFLVQKRAERASDPDADGRALFYVHCISEEDLEPFLLAAEWPGSVEAWCRWMQACDFLLVDLRAHELGHSIVNCLRPWLDLAGARRRIDPLAPDAKRLTRLYRDPFLAEGPLALGGDGYSLAASSTGTEEQSQAREEGLKGLLDFEVLLGLGRLDEVVSVAGRFIRKGLTDEDMQGDAAWLPRAPVDMIPAVSAIGGALHQLSSTVAGSLFLLEKLPGWSRELGCVACRHLVQRACSALYLAECLGAVSAVFMPLATVEALQRAYVAGDLTLNCFLPVQEGSFFLLPGLRGKREVPPLFSEPRDVLDKAFFTVPWLRGVLCAAGPRLFLTGSLLCYCRSKEDFSPRPSDCDVFCLAEEELEHAANVVQHKMSAFAKMWGFDRGSVTVEKLSSRRFKLRLDRRGSFPGSTRLLADCCFSCDLYAHAVERISQYHLAQVRACLFVDHQGAPHLSVLPSAAIAWIQTISLDHHEIRGQKSSSEIVASYWQRGFNLLMRRGKLLELTAYLEREEPLLLAAARSLQRPQRLTPFRCELPPCQLRPQRR